MMREEREREREREREKEHTEGDGELIIVRCLLRANLALRPSLIVLRCVAFPGGVCGATGCSCNTIERSNRLSCNRSLQKTCRPQMSVRRILFDSTSCSTTSSSCPAGISLKNACRSSTWKGPSNVLAAACTAVVDIALSSLLGRFQNKIPPILVLRLTSRWLAFRNEKSKKKSETAEQKKGSVLGQEQQEPWVAVLAFENRRSGFFKGVGDMTTCCGPACT